MTPDESFPPLLAAQPSTPRETPAGLSVDWGLSGPLSCPGSRPVPLKSVCRIVRQIVGELVLLFGDRVLVRRDRRRLACHVRQISMYVCHVALRISQSDIGDAFGRDRTTVGHACHVVEDRRDDPVFDDFVSAMERVVTAVFGTPEFASDD
ncbi:transposase [Neorhizobium sp. T786]|uniref:helix-turn-helix domain-containing protein n=1 Tax=Pseudorhizobium xiangyangii TaxID=2883104 RepID=UPI001CFFA6B1|nr:helix-turn-helix domain-containing protein [Neorhizobium xiangyangii]MCB5202770.1 transposase [Neorhizobium xiangyangii]